MKISINREVRIGCGACEALCPEIFKLLEDGKSGIVEKSRKGETGKGEVKEDLAKYVKNAKTSCPVEVTRTD